MRWRDAGLGWQDNISADSAAASRAELTFSEKLGERGEDQVKVRRRKRETHPRVTKRDGKYLEKTQAERATKGERERCCD